MTSAPEAEALAGPAAERWRFDLGYDGTGFSGWAEQPDRRTVQGELQLWLSRLLPVDSSVRLICAGRTDAGVHARGQVAHLDLPAGVLADPDRLRRRLARVLPADLAVRAINPAPAHFDARFAAIWRRYVYRLSDPATPYDPLWRHQVTRSPAPLDVEAMNAAAPPLLGLRDFGAFCKQRAGATTIRTLLELQVERLTTGPLTGVVECTVRADAFCHSMVRSLVGGLTEVGCGRRDADWLVATAAAVARSPAVSLLPPGGLTLEEVGYPPADQLADRVREARTRRELR